MTVALSMSRAGFSIFAFWTDFGVTFAIPSGHLSRRAIVDAFARAIALTFSFAIAQLSAAVVVALHAHFLEIDARVCHITIANVARKSGRTFTNATVE